MQNICSLIDQNINYAPDFLIATAGIQWKVKRIKDKWEIQNTWITLTLNIYV